MITTLASDTRTNLEQFEQLGYCDEVIEAIRKSEEIYLREGDLQHLYDKVMSFYKKGLDERQKVEILIKASLEITSIDNPHWEYVASRFLKIKVKGEIDENNSEHDVKNFYDKLKCYTNQGYYGEHLLEHYSEEEVAFLEDYIDNTRDGLLTYSSLIMLYRRYLLRTHDNKVFETPQEMFLTIAMHLGMSEEKNRLEFVKSLYDILSQLKVTMATPTMSSARKPIHQLSSCFIDTVDDSLSGIYKSIDNFAKVSKSGGGMGLYFGKVRANGSDIRGFKGVAGGVVRWIKLANDTAVAVDQLGVRQGAVAVYLDIWHKDIPEFLQLKTNNGDERGKAHDVFPGVCYPDLFWKKVKEDMEGDWHLMCPHEIKTVKGYALEDSFGEEWVQRYESCIDDPRIDKRVVKIKELVRMIIKSAVETGTPFTFNRDHVNRMNPNSHQGMIYSSNLCTEIMQNMSALQTFEPELMTVNGESVVVDKSIPGDFVVCNLASLVLGRINVDDKEEMRHVIGTVIRALDNVIDHNSYPVPYAKHTNKRYRALGLGISGYHHLLAKRGIRWESQEHLTYVASLFEEINYMAIEASMSLAKEKGAYPLFEGSKWSDGQYFDDRGYKSEEWNILKEAVHEHGIRNGYLLAIAPTGSTSIIAGTTAGIDPIMHKYYLEEKRGDIIPRVAPELTLSNYWLYKSAHTIDQNWSIKAAGIRQEHIDQSQSMNLYITTDHSMRQILELLLNAWEAGVKTLYYVRSKSLEVEECESCSS